MIAGSWRAALAAAPHTHVVANADDPLVVWGAGAARDVHWVGAGLRWQHDAVGCPSCEGRIEFTEDDWSCAGCGFARPDPEATLVSVPDGTARAEWADGRRAAVRLSLPGRFNRSNALMAAVAAEASGVSTPSGPWPPWRVSRKWRGLHGALVRRRARLGPRRPRTRRAGRVARPGGRLEGAAVQHRRGGSPTVPTPVGCGTSPTSA